MLWGLGVHVIAVHEPIVGWVSWVALLVVGIVGVGARGHPRIILPTTTPLTHLVFVRGLVGRTVVGVGRIVGGHVGHVRDVGVTDCWVCGHCGGELGGLRQPTHQLATDLWERKCLS